MKPIRAISIVACMILKLGTVHADFEPTETAINGETVFESTCFTCSLTEVPSRKCTTRSPECRVYLQSNVPPALSVETLAFSVGDDDTVAWRHFYFWDVEHSRWVVVQDGDRDINITKDGDEWTVENADPYPFYF